MWCSLPQSFPGSRHQAQPPGRRGSGRIELSIVQVPGCTGQYVALVLKPEKTMDTLSMVPLSIDFAINVLVLGGDGRTMRSEF
jgi:hypothetical protein